MSVKSLRALRPFPAGVRRILTPSGAAGIFEPLEQRRLLSTTFPVADAGGPYFITQGESLPLDASGSHHPDGKPLTYAWDINGDGIFGEYVGANPQPFVPYADLVTMNLTAPRTAPDRYDIALRVTDSDNNAHTVHTYFELANAAPEVTLLPGANSYLEGQFVNFTASASDYHTHPADLVYDWVATLNGNVIGTQSGPFNSWGVQVRNQGTFQVDVTVTDPDGAATTRSYSRTIANVLPSLGTPQLHGTLVEGQTLTAFVPASDPGLDDVLKYRLIVARQIPGTSIFTLVHDITSTDPAVDFNVADDGFYAFQFAVSDDVGPPVQTTTRTFTVANAAPQPTVSGVPASPVAPQSSVILTASPNDPGLLDTHTYAWTVTLDGAPFASGTGSSVAFVADLAGTYAYHVIVTDNAGASGSAAGSFVVAEADLASIEFTGQQHVTTTGPEDHAAHVILRARVLDLDGIGDVSSATVTFFDLDTGIPLASGVPVIPLAADPLSGTATATIVYELTQEAVTLQVGMRLEGGYTGIGSAIITISHPGGGRLVGGGSLLSTSGGGLFAAAAQTRVSFGFQARSHAQAGVIQGSVSLTYSSYLLPDGSTSAQSRLYLIESTEIQSLATTGPAGVMRAAVTISDITDPDNRQLIASGLTLEMRISDLSSNGKLDRAAFTIWGGSTLFFSSNWDGLQTIDQLLHSGNVKVWNL